MLGFKGGIHPKDKKELTAKKDIEKAEIPKKVTILLKQHAGAPAKPIVNEGDEVKLGQMIAEPEGLGANIHASVSGKIIRIKDVESSLFGRVPAITIENNKKEEWQFLEEKEPIEMIKEAGIVGMGGAMFPTHIKLAPPKDKKIDTLIINGAECEPYLTCDYRLMKEKSEEILEGIQMLLRILGIKDYIIAVEDNKRDVKLKNTKLLKTKYPEGAEKTLINVLLKKEIPPNGLPFDVGVIVSNIGTAYAVQQAVKEKKPLTERVVTVAGAVKEPKNLLVRIGTPVKELIKECGGVIGYPKKIISGGPMMGICIKEEEPVLKGTSGILVMNGEMAKETDEKPCIRCSGCINVCPMRLMPNLIANNVKSKKHKALESLNIFDCFECGACSYACPAHIPLVKYIKEGKAKCRK